MMRFLKYIFVLSILGNFVQGQTRIDSLLNMLDEVKISQDKLSLLDSLTKDMIKSNHVDQKQYLREYVDLAQTLGRYDQMASKSRFLIQQYIMKGDTAKAFGYINEMLTFKQEFKTEKSEAHLLLKRGGVHFSILDYTKAIEDYDIAAGLFMISKDSIFAADSFFFSGQANSNQGNFPQAIFNLEKAYNLYEALNDFGYMMYVGSELNLMFERNGLKSEAKNKLEVLLKASKARKAYDQVVFFKFKSIRNKIDDDDLEGIKADLDSIAQLLPKIKDSSIKIRNEHLSEATSLLYYLQINDLESAEKSYNRLLSVESKMGHASAQSGTIFVKVKYLKAQGMLSEALQMLNTFRQRVSSKKNTNVNYNIMDIEKLYADIYRGLGDFSKSNSHLQNYIKFKDSLNSRSTANALAFHQSRFESAQKEKTILKRDYEIQQLEIKSEKAAKNRNILISLLIGIGMLGFGIWWNGKNKRALLGAQLEQKRLDLDNFTKELLLKSKEKEALTLEVNVLKKSIEDNKPSISNLQELANSKILTKDDWYDFKQKFSLVHPDFLINIRNSSYQFTESEERLLALEKLNLNNKDISSILGIASKSVVVTRYRLRKKLNIPSEMSIVDYLENVVVTSN